MNFVDLPQGVLTIAQEAFAECKNLISAVLPASVSSIREGVFKNCTRLKYVRFSGVEVIPPYTLEGCTNLSLADFSPALKRIQSFACQNCGLTEIEVPSGAVIEENAFDSKVHITHGTCVYEEKHDTEELMNLMKKLGF